MANTDKIIWTGGMWKHTFFSDDIAIDHIILDKTFGSAYGEEIDGIGWNYVYIINDIVTIVDLLWVPNKNRDFYNGTNETIGAVPKIYKLYNASQIIYFTNSSGSPLNSYIDGTFNKISITSNMYLGKGYDIIPIYFSWIKKV